MKKKILSAIVIVLSSTALAQTGINTISPRATLDVVGKPADTTTTDGIIAPRMTRAELIAKTGYGTNQTGSIVYITDISGTTGISTSKVTGVGYYYFDGTTWQKIGGAGWSLTGNSGTNSNVNFVGTTDDIDFKIKRNGIAVASFFKNNNMIFGHDYSAISNFGNTSNNIGIGQFSLGGGSIGSYNIALGFKSLGISMGDSIGNGNIGIGRNAGQGTGGDNNICIGNYTLSNGLGVIMSQNVALGQNILVGGTKNILIGYHLEFPNSTNNLVSNSINIGNSIYGFNINNNNLDPQATVSEADLNLGDDLIGIATSSPTNTLDVNGTTRVRTLQTGVSTDKVVVADANGVLKSVNRSEFAEIVGNEVTNATTNGGLALAGSGTAQDPLTVGIKSGYNSGDILKWDGTKWRVTNTVISSNLQELIDQNLIFDNEFVKCSYNINGKDIRAYRFFTNYGDFSCSLSSRWIYNGLVIRKSDGKLMSKGVILSGDTMLPIDKRMLGVSGSPGLVFDNDTFEEPIKTGLKDSNNEEYEIPSSLIKYWKTSSNISSWDGNTPY